MSRSVATLWRHKCWARLREAIPHDLEETPAASEDENISNSMAKLSIQPGDVHGTAIDTAEPTAAHEQAHLPGPSQPSQSSPNPPPPPKPPSRQIASQLDDLLHIQLSFIQNMLAFSATGRSLRFLRDPAHLGAFRRWDIDSGDYCNSGDGALHPKHPTNFPFIQYQNELALTYFPLKGMATTSVSDGGHGDDIKGDEVDEYRRGLLRQVLEELERLEDLKEWEWEQHQASSTGPSQSVQALGSRYLVNTDRHIASQWTSWTLATSIIYSYSIVSATSNLLLGLSRQATGIVMAGMRSTIRTTLEYARSPDGLTPQDQRLLRQLVRDPRTVLNALDLDPHVTAYNCCSRCFALYKLGDTNPDMCSAKAAPESAECGAKLWRSRKIGDGKMSFPVRKYLHQSLKHWLGRMLCQSSIEAWLQVVRWNDGRIRTPMRDIFDGIALQSLRGPNGQPFLNSVSEELQLVFGLSADGFNPYQMKEAKHSVTSTAIYMVCLNLPENLRHLPENIFLVGVIPGPTKPSIDQMNHFLALLVDELLDFWDPGVYYTKTALRPAGRLVRAALVPLIADLLAARQLSGFGPHNHSQVLCSICTTVADNVEDTDFQNFQPRNLEAHRAAARAWLEAHTTLKREELFLQTGVRHSELLRLRYWNPLLYTVIDTMHNLYLGILQRHIRIIWGINVDEEDGDASGINSGAAPERPGEDKMAAGTALLLCATPKQLAKAGKAVLYHLCVDRGLRRAGTISQLVKNLDAWRKKEGILIAQEPPNVEESGSTSFPDYGLALNDDIKRAEQTLRGPKASTALARKKKEVLQAMCQVRGIDVRGTKAQLADSLLAWLAALSVPTAERAGEPLDGRTEPAVLDDGTKTGAPAVEHSERNSTDESQSQPERSKTSSRSPQHAIGRHTLAAYMEDRSRMVLPSWMNAPPVAFGTKQHGKLSADQWRTLCTVNLPVTLIRMWSFQEERRVKMLENFLAVVEAVETFGLLEIDERQIKSAERLMQKYLDSLKDLYKGAKIQPNHHLALHIGVFLRLFGPVHSWRSFVFERFNYYLQSLNTNMTFGELEVTFMMHSCRAANFRPLLRSPVVERHMQDFSKSLRASERDDHRGMRLDAILRSAMEDEAPQTNGDPYKSSRPIALESHVYQALLRRLSFESDTYMDERKYYAETPVGKLPLPHSATLCSSVPIAGVQYKPWKKSLGDSNIIFKHPTMDHGTHPGCIEHIFLHTRRGTLTGQEITQTFLSVKSLRPLDAVDAPLDPYRKYPTVGGRLYYDTYSEETLILRTDDVMSHFAQTSMDHLTLPSIQTETSTEPQLHKFSKPCVHVRPLDRVLFFLHLAPHCKPLMDFVLSCCGKRVRG